MGKSLVSGFLTHSVYCFFVDLLSTVAIQKLTQSEFYLRISCKKIQNVFMTHCRSLTRFDTDDATRDRQMDVQYMTITDCTYSALWSVLQKQTSKVHRCSGICISRLLSTYGVVTEATCTQPSCSA